MHVKLHVVLGAAYILRAHKRCNKLQTSADAWGRLG